MRALASRMSVMSGEGALSVFAHARELERQGRSIIHLELGEPDFHPAEPVIDALHKAVKEGKDRYCRVADVQRRIAELAVKHDLYVLSDEIYARIIYRPNYLSMLTYPGMEERTLIIDGFSKSFAMTGWRLGYTVAPAHIVPALVMLAINSYTCVTEFTQYAAVEALRDRAQATPRMVKEFAQRREQFVRDLNRVPGFRCTPPEGAFYAWVNISDTGSSAEEICRIMLDEAGVAAIPGAAFGASGKDFVRFSFASSTATLQEAVDRILKVASAWQGTLARR